MSHRPDKRSKRMRLYSFDMWGENTYRAQAESAIAIRKCLCPVFSNRRLIQLLTCIYDFYFTSFLSFISIFHLCISLTSLPVLLDLGRQRPYLIHLYIYTYSDYQVVSETISQLSGIKQQPFSYTHWFCGSRIWKGDSRLISLYFMMAWGSAPWSEWLVEQ